MLEVAPFGLVDQGVAVGKEQDALLGAALPETMDNLKGSVGLAGAGGHDQQYPILPFGNCFNGAVNSYLLVVARSAARTVIEVVKRGNLFLMRGINPFVCFVALPEFFRRGEIIKVERALYTAG